MFMGDFIRGDNQIRTGDEGVADPHQNAPVSQCLWAFQGILRGCDKFVTNLLYL